MDKIKTNEKSIKNRSKINKVFDIFLLVFCTIALAVSGVLMYQRVYLEPFYVNGQSMYPTLNKDATRPDGSKEGINGGSSDIGDTMLDYGVMDCHKKAIQKLKRFDIVVTYHNANKSAQLIKRLIGLPGETIKFISSNPSNPENGDLYVKQGDEFVLVQQPIEDKYKVAASNYPTTEIVLGDDEYYFLGDNRAHSSDCRDYGVFKREWIVGKVIAIAGTCSLRKGQNGENEPFNVKYFLWPRFIK